MGGMELLTNLARLVVAADRFLTDQERIPLEPELSELVQEFNVSAMGAFMPLSAYPFDGDRAKAVERWIRDSLE